MRPFELTSRSIHAFVGIGALFGGMLAFSSPDGTGFGLPAAEALNNSPFESFLIPGIFLFVVIGLGNLFALAISLLKNQYHAYVSGCLGVIQCMWIVIQCMILSEVHILHIIFFIIGALQIFLAAILLYKHEYRRRS